MTEPIAKSLYATALLSEYVCRSRRPFTGRKPLRPAPRPWTEPKRLSDVVPSHRAVDQRIPARRARSAVDRPGPDGRFLRAGDLPVVPAWHQRGHRTPTGGRAAIGARSAHQYGATGDERVDSADRLEATAAPRAQSPTAGRSEEAVKTRAKRLSTDALLVQNIAALLRTRGHEKQELARWMGHHPTWVSKILLRQRGLSLKEIDRAAAFFGLDGYQLLAPGLTAERRSGVDRRRNGKALR